jgi:hypothetical protein
VQHGRSGAEPSPLDGLQVEGGLADKKVQIIYRIGGASYDSTAVTLNGQELSFTREANPHRTGDRGANGGGAGAAERWHERVARLPRVMALSPVASSC